MKLYTHKTRLLSRCFMKTVIVLILTIVVLVNMTGKAKADIIALWPTDFFLSVMEAKDRIEIINQFLTRNDDNDDKVFLFLDYPYPEYIEDLDFKGFSEETQCSINTQQCSVYFEEHSIIIMEINNFYPFTDEKEEKIRDQIEEIARFQEQNSDKDFIILDYDSETGETQEFELPDIADISELIKLIESSTGWKLSEQYSPIDQLADLIEFFNESVEDGTLEGRGSGWLAELRL